MTNEEKRPYEFITRADVTDCWRPNIPNDVIKTVNRLWGEREAYRKVAVRFHAASCCDGIGGDKEHGDDIDAEARKILEGEAKKGEGR